MFTILAIRNGQATAIADPNRAQSTQPMLRELSPTPPKQSNMSTLVTSPSNVRAITSSNSFDSKSSIGNFCGRYHMSAEAAKLFSTLQESPLPQCQEVCRRGWSADGIARIGGHRCGRFSCSNHLFSCNSRGLLRRQPCKWPLVNRSQRLRGQPPHQPKRRLICSQNSGMYWRHVAIYHIFAAILAILPEQLRFLVRTIVIERQLSAISVRQRSVDQRAGRS